MSNGRRGGQPGNQNGVRDKIWRDAIKRALSRCATEATEDSPAHTIGAGLDKIAGKLVRAAFDGDEWAIGHIADRLDGKAVQAIASEDGQPVRFIGVVELVKPAAG